MEATQINDSISRASLLGLPPELRLKIYDILIESDIFQPVFEPKSAPTGQSLIKPVRLPVASLAMSCSLISSEIHGHMHALPSSERFAVVKAYTEGWFTTADFFFRRAPCSIFDLTTLKVSLEIKPAIHLPRSHSAGFVNVKDAASLIYTNSFLLKELLEVLFKPGSVFANARAMSEVQVHIHVIRGKGGLETDESHNWLMETFHLVYDTHLRNYYWIECDRRISVRIEDFSREC